MSSTGRAWERVSANFGKDLSFAVRESPRMEVSPITRKHLVDELQLAGVSFHGGLSEIEFLERLFPLDQLPSTDSRFATMAEDIAMHRVQFPEDWPDSWVWGDERLKLRDGPSELFLRFLSEMLHPIVRANEHEVAKLLALVNRHLAHDGIEIAPAGHVHNRVVYGARLVGGGSRVVQRQQTFISLGAHVAQQVERLRKHDADPAAAIGAAKELAETVCKTVLHARGVSYSKDDELPRLAKRMMEAIDVVPAGFAASAEATKTLQRLLSNLANIPHCLAELRNLSGSGHGREASFRALGPAYARLAADSAATFAAFIVEVSGLVSEPTVMAEEAAE